MTKYIFTLLFCPLLLNAKENDFSEFPPDREFVYKSIDDTDLKLYVYDPEGHKITDKKPVIILFFGGGWSGGQASRLSGQCDFFAKKGIVAITADYRVKGRHKTTPKESVKDGKSAIRLIRSHADELGIDRQTPPTIVFFGDNDKHVPVETAEKYQQKMKAVGAHCDLFIYPGQGHGFFNYRPGGAPKKNVFFNKTMNQSAIFLESLGYL